LPRLKPGDPPSPESTRPVYWRERGAPIDTPVFWGPTLVPGSSIAGPAVAEYPNTTIIVRPAQALRTDDYGNVIVTLKEGS
jgi:N-methylhydantoinase A